MLRIPSLMRTSSGYHSHRSGDQGKDGGGASETTTNSGSNKHPAPTDDEEEDEPAYVEASPCSRWQKRRETVTQRDIPGIDASYLAMDTEEGVEVVWNEVLFSERKISEAQHNKISQVFDKLIELNHMNIVKFHGYWQDRTKADDRPRVVFITEYMSSGSLKHFLRKTKRTKQSLSKNSWRRWCIQLLSALNYLHSCDPPIIHGNLTCDTIFIQNTGLLKIGSIHYLQLKAFEDLGHVAPDVLHHHVKSIPDSAAKNLHFQAPEMTDDWNNITTAVDIYSLGMVTLEMINLDLGGNGDTHAVTDEVVNEAIHTLDNPLQKDLILKCVELDPLNRPTARELLFHPALFSIPSLKLLSVHMLADEIRLKPDRPFISSIVSSTPNEQIFAELYPIREGAKPVVFTFKDCPPFDLDKLLEDVQNGLHPIAAYHLLFPPKSSSLIVPTKLSIPSDKSSSSSSSSLSLPSITSTITTPETDLTTPLQSMTDSSLFHLINSNDPLNSTQLTNNHNNTMTNGNKSRISMTTRVERSGSTVSNDQDHHHRNESISTINLPNSTSITHNGLLPTSISNMDEKENRRVLDVQCKVKSKETGSSMLFISVKFQDRLQRDMTAEIESDETPDDIAKELLELGLIHEDDYNRIEQSIDKAFNGTMNTPDANNSTSASVLDVKKTAVAAAAAALQNQINLTSTNGPTHADASTGTVWTGTPSPPVMFLPP